MELHELSSNLGDWLDLISIQLQKIPGSSIFLRYIRSSYQNDPIRSAVELILFLFAVRYLLAPSYSTGKGHVKLSEDEIDELIDEWQPEPLAQAPTAAEEAELEKRPVIASGSLPRTRLVNGRVVTNLASYNFYNFASSDVLKEKAIQVLSKYGVGPCSPPNFYGTMDVHMKSEADVMTHIGTDACIIYAQAVSTISSVIPSFSKRGDIIVADEALSYAPRRGIQISRSTVRWYKHNDMADLERVLQRVVREQSRRPLTRRFIVTEGLFENTGDIADLPSLVELKLKYKFRLILEESLSYGVLGRTGAGLTEHQNVDATFVDMIIGSLAGPFCAGGGFCAGNRDIVEHQRISSAAYTFSAALAPMMATTASETVQLLQENPELVTTLREHIKALRAQLDPRSEWIWCPSDVNNPVQLVVWKDELIASRGWSREEQDLLLQEVVDECLNNGVLVTRLKAMPSLLGVATKDQGWQPQPAIKVCATTGLSKKETEKAGTVIRHAIAKIASRHK